MKCKIIIMTIVIIVTLVLSACEIDNHISEFNVDNIPKTNVSVTKEQSNVPYLGDEEITPLFIGRNSISDWIKDIKRSDTEYVFHIDGATGEVRLDLRSSDKPDYNIASFYVEKNICADFCNNEENCIFKTLPNEIMKLKVIEVVFLDFENMGIYYNVRDIIKGSSVNDLKKAFLDMKNEVDTTGVPYQELYNIRDVDPNAKIEPRYENYWLIGGLDSITIEQGGFREITYFHTKLYDNENENYSICHSRSVISFLIDTNGKVAGLRYEKTQM